MVFIVIISLIISIFTLIFERVKMIGILSSLGAKENLLSKIFITLLYILTYYAIKFVLIKFLSFSFKLKEISRLILFFTLMFDRVLAIVMFPLLICMFFFYIDAYDFLVCITYSLMLILLFLKSICFINLGYNSFGISKFYIFLYLCVLEFFPIMILVKTILF